MEKYNIKKYVKRVNEFTEEFQEAMWFVGNVYLHEVKAEDSPFV